jgi:hypothetical protein
MEVRQEHKESPRLVVLQNKSEWNEENDDALEA